jgi:hypothetical protein
MQAWESQIIRISTGRLNTVNDTVIGGIAGISGVSKYAGQLGKTVTFGNDQIANMYSSSVGTIPGGGRFRYVKMRAADDDSPALTPGKILFWDTTVTNWATAYQVTRDVNLSSAQNGVMVAGIYLGGFEPGNYGFIQDMGFARVRFQSVLTAAGAIGSPVYVGAAADTGDDQGTADVLSTDSTALANLRHLGVAVAAPTGGQLQDVLLNFFNALAVA